jgi:phage-related protein
MGIELTVQLAAGLIQAIPQLVAKLPEIIAAIVTGLGKAVGAVFEIGKNIVTGLWEGIKSLGSWIADKVSGFFSGIVDGAKSLLGINSPSKVFAGIGENMGLGIGEGFTDAMKGVEKDITNALPTDFDLDMNTASTK